mmetsp:Transcript_7025/g.10072  ORF Transcript_7025/g.10072 Transcript_7025/m.10072 type:complete len:1669 (-) Transcript_7025:301-5307(-)|eukprot:CAMPEP_0184862010 /NCGR_PEP_ID=MMETSP0580-20130426/6555_1 /TAXON_ID=1118495 /ORGANISM="Dactyliosolen fragilissimus" /LENGTH=1668 /DNA_ID=CAMNT_0027359709 /DNA_START=32 /DNA_END=5038 /DNA_ORIENTATION=-
MTSLNTATDMVGVVSQVSDGGNGYGSDTSIDSGGHPRPRLESDANNEMGVDDDKQQQQQQQPHQILDPLLLAIDDLEGRIVSSLDNFKLHPGIRTGSLDANNNNNNQNQNSNEHDGGNNALSSSSQRTTVYDELNATLRPVLEIAAHVGPATARSHAAYRPSIDAAVEEIYRRLNSDLVLPVLLESAQSDPTPSKRASALTFFHELYKEYKHAGSYLDPMTHGLYGDANATPGKDATNTNVNVSVNKDPNLTKQRLQHKSNRSAELLRYWVEGSAACTVPGAFSGSRADGAIASRAVLSASAVVRPALRHVGERIAAADDNGALRLYIPVMRMISGVLRRLFSPQKRYTMKKRSKQEELSEEALRSSCIKFLEIVVLCFSTRIQPGATHKRRRESSLHGTSGATSDNNFALDDLPVGHHIITRQALEEIGEDAFTILRGLATVGGQAKVDSGVMRDVMLSLGLDASGSGSTPSAQIMAILRPAALSFLEIDSSLQQHITEEYPYPPLDRSNIDTDFDLSQKSYAITINAVSMLATNRPIFFKDSATCLARRTMDGPTLPQAIPSSSNKDDTPISTSITTTITTTLTPTSVLSKSVIMTINSHLKASCLTLLRNSLSVTSGASTILYNALSSPNCKMNLQADKALNMARQAAALKTAKRAVRNRAATYYEWDVSISTEMQDLSNKRKRMGDTALEKMRAAKAARGLGNGIQLPTNMVDATELILVNLCHLPPSRASVIKGEKTTTDKTSISMTGANGSSSSEILHTHKRKKPINLDFLIDAIMSNGASLISDESKWYARDGGAAWMMDISAMVSDDEFMDDDDNKDNEDSTMIYRKLDTGIMKQRSERRAHAPISFQLDNKTIQVGKKAAMYDSKQDNRKESTSTTSETKETKKEVDDVKLYREQCEMASSDAFKRIVVSSGITRDSNVADLGNRIAARLAWTLHGVPPSGELKNAKDLALEGIVSKIKATDDVVEKESVKSKNTRRSDDRSHRKKVDGNAESHMEGKSKSLARLEDFVKEYPLVSSCLALDTMSSKAPHNVTGLSANGKSKFVANTNDTVGIMEKSNAVCNALVGTSSSLTCRTLNEAYFKGLEANMTTNNILKQDDESVNTDAEMKQGGEKVPGIKTSRGFYDKSLDLLIVNILHACKKSNDKPSDNQKRKIATIASSSLPYQLAIAPSLTDSALEHTSSLCDIESITKKAAEAARKASNQNLASSAAAHAAKTAAEKRATGALLALRDAAFQRNRECVRRSVIDCAVGIATGRLPASFSIEDKALKLVMNVLFPKADNLANVVVASATSELERAATYAVDNYKKIQKANDVTQAKKRAKNPQQPYSNEEKVALEYVRKPVVLFMALCIRRPEIIKILLKVGCRDKANILGKAIRNNMVKLTRAAATKYGAAKIALQVSDLASEVETPLLLSFLDNLVPSDSNLPSDDLIEACHEIQSNRLNDEGKKDARFIIPILSGMKRQTLENKLPEFVHANDNVFRAALDRMRERVGRHALTFRDEPNKSNPSLNGMTLCEQIVYLHRLDFAASNLPQKRYLDVIRICLEDHATFTDQVIMAALDYISGTYLEGEERLPLAYMRTIILTCSHHETLHPWICHVLLPRLIEGKVYKDRRQWEGWMRCAKMLENAGDSGVSSLDAIQKLPEEQYLIYRAKYPSKK